MQDTIRWIPGRPGVRPLAPRRDIKLQVCFSAEERVRLDAQARAAGFESVGAFIRDRTVGGSPGEPRLTV